MYGATENHESHRCFVRKLNKLHLKELLCRSYDSSNGSLLANETLQEFQTAYPDDFANNPDIIVQTNVVKSTQYQNPSDIYIIVIFKHTEIDSKIGHITFHLIPNKHIKELTSNGLMHIKHNAVITRKRRLHITTENIGLQKNTHLKLADALHLGEI